jgi:hypothetical protein
MPHIDCTLIRLCMLFTPLITDCDNIHSGYDTSHKHEKIIRDIDVD